MNIFKYFSRVHCILLRTKTIFCLMKQQITLHRLLLILYTIFLLFIFYFIFFLCLTNWLSSLKKNNESSSKFQISLLILFFVTIKSYCSVRPQGLKRNKTKKKLAKIDPIPLNLINSKRKRLMHSKVTVQAPAKKKVPIRLLQINNNKQTKKKLSNLAIT